MPVSASSSRWPSRRRCPRALSSRPRSGPRAGFHASAQTKAAIAEGSFSPELPGIEMPNKYLSFPYEPTRLSSYLPGAAMDLRQRVLDLGDRARQRGQHSR